MPDYEPYTPETDYFILGDGHLCAAIQTSGHQSASPYGVLLVGHPESPSAARKHATLLFHPELGLGRTMATVILNGQRFRAAHGATAAAWNQGFNETAVTWTAGHAVVTERFYIDDAPRLVRHVQIHDTQPGDAISIELALYANPLYCTSFSADGQTLYAGGLHRIQLRCHHPAARTFERFITVDASQATFSYTVNEPETPQDNPAPAPAHTFTPCSATLPGHTLTLQELYRLSANALRAVVSHQGGFNASLWQYEFQWGLDAAMVANAAACCGNTALSKQVLTAILTRLSNDVGMIAEAGRFRGGPMSELSGNGGVLDALWKYWRYSGDDDFVEEYFGRIAAIANYPLRAEFRHESGLLQTQRDFWERPPWNGVGPGFELGHQVLCAAGLRGAAEMARHLGHTAQADKWNAACAEITHATLHHPQWALVQDGAFVRRRLTDGSVEQSIRATGYNHPAYAPYIPPPNPDAPALQTEPDTTQALPILYGLADPHGELAAGTMRKLQALWLPDGGGYARYNTASDPDSPGAWPFASMFVAAAELDCGLTQRAQRTLDWLRSAAGHGGCWFEFYNALRHPPFPPKGIIVWGWAQYIILYTEHIMGIRITEDGLRVCPKMTGPGHTVRNAGYTIHVSVGGLRSARLDGNPVQLRNGAVLLPLPLQQDHTLEFLA